MTVVGQCNRIKGLGGLNIELNIFLVGRIEKDNKSKIFRALNVWMTLRSALISESDNQEI